MNAIFSIWRAEIKSARNALQHDSRMRAVSAIIFVFDVTLGYWSVVQLRAHVLEWQALGSAALDGRLWLVSIGIWIGIALFAAMSLLGRGFGNDTAQLLLTLPLPAPELFLALYGMILGEGLWNWLVLSLGVVGAGLGLALGGRAATWLAVIVLGQGVAVWCATALALLFIRYALANTRQFLRRAALPVLALGILLAIARPLGPTMPLHAALSPPAPEWIGLLLAAWLAVALGPLAGTTGRLYVAAFQVMEGLNRASAPVRLPGMQMVIRWLSHSRNLTGALSIKMLLSQSRHALAWGRVLVVLILLGLFPQVRQAFGPLAIPDSIFVPAYAACLALASILEYAPYAISGEGSRLSLYLTAPLTWGEFLGARLLTYLLPVLVEGLAFCLGLGWWSGLTPVQIGFGALALILILLGIAALYVWGSVADEDINAPVEGIMQALLLEEAPSSAGRTRLLALGLGLLAAALFLFWRLPAWLALPLLLLLDAVVLAGTWWFSHVSLRRLVRQG